MLKIENLYAEIDGNQILKGINLEIKEGEVHAIMGLNGSGKSTLSNVLAGNPLYKVSKGKVSFNDKDLLLLSPEERAGEGIFLSFQNPIELPGVMLNYFLRTSLNEIRKYRGEKEVGLKEFRAMLEEKATKLNFPSKIISRFVNEGFSGGEKKRCEILQLSFLKPKLAILDEIDSGLDIDALFDVSNAINEYKKENPKASFLLITHYKRLLDYIKPDKVHVIINGKIVRSEDASLADKLEKDGYAWLEE
ncbi:MAG: Fe-S cluster assembly ATPase SufC [Bdellovibrionota bacterium]